MKDFVVPPVLTAQTKTDVVNAMSAESMKTAKSIREAFSTAPNTTSNSA
jgi:hypothetical protein